MKLPKTQKKYCKHCKKQREVTVTRMKQRTRSSTHPLSKGGKTRTKARGERRGYGNLGRYSKIKKPKRGGAKVSKKVVPQYKCKECKKTFAGTSFRTKKLEIKEKGTK